MEKTSERVWTYATAVISSGLLGLLLAGPIGAAVGVVIGVASVRATGTEPDDGPG